MYTDKHRNTHSHVDKNVHVQTQSRDTKDLGGKGRYKISKWKRITRIPHTRKI